MVVIVMVVGMVVMVVVMSAHKGKIRKIMGMSRPRDSEEGLC
jgi:nucleoside diphosphate kinase